MDAGDERHRAALMHEAKQASSIVFISSPSLTSFPASLSLFYLAYLPTSYRPESSVVGFCKFASSFDCFLVTVGFSWGLQPAVMGRAIEKDKDIPTGLGCVCVVECTLLYLPG